MDGYSFVKILMTTLTDFRIKGGYIYVLAVINQTKMKESDTLRLIPLLGSLYWTPSQTLAM